MFNDLKTILAQAWKPTIYRDTGGGFVGAPGLC